jgi:hypothetical protein
MLFPNGELATLHVRTVTGQDAYGNDTYATADVLISGCAFDPGGSTEFTIGGDRVLSQPTLYLPPDVAVPTAVDSVSVRGQSYEIDGVPAWYPSPFTGWNPGGVVKLRRVTG